LKKITIVEKDGLWYSKFTGDEEGEIRRLFHTNVIPTPYSSSYPKSKVVDDIKRRNHGYIVE
jgi:hypothetical protein